MTRPLAALAAVLILALWGRAALIEAADDARLDELARRLAGVAAHVGDVDEALARHEHDAATDAEAWQQRCRWVLQHSRDSEALRDSVATRCPRCQGCEVTWASAEGGP